MDFDAGVSKVLGVLYSLGNQGLLNKSESRPTVIKELKEVIHNAPDTSKSRITFLMVLNTQLSVTEDLKNDNYVCLFTNTTPEIQKEYLITYAYDLNLQQQLFEVIENCPGAVSLELLNIIVEKLKEPTFHKNEYGYEHIYQLWESIFVKICKIDAGFHVNDSCSSFIKYFQEVYDLIQKILITSMKIQEGVEDFIGFHLYNFLKSVLCFLQHKNIDLKDDLVYQLSVEFKSEESDPTIDHIKACNSMVFKQMFKILENITIDIWLGLSQCFFDTSSKDSMQLLIGYIVWDILEEVKGLKDFDVPFDVLNCLSSLAIKKSDIRAKASIDEIVENVENDEKEWFPALLSHFTCEKSLKCLIKYLHLASLDDLNVILNKSYEICSEGKSENLELVKRLFLKAVKILPDSSEWVKKVFSKYQPNLLTTAETHDEIVKTFNKISTKKDIADCDLISLCMRSPLETIKRICNMAVCGSHQINFIIEILKLLKEPCNSLPDDGCCLLDYVLLKSVLKDLTKAEKQQFVSFVVELGKEKLLSDLFFNDLLNTVKECLESEMLETAVICLEVIKPLLCLEVSKMEEAPFLVFMSQVLGFFSWDLEGFSVVKLEGRDAAECIVDLVISRLGGTDGPEFQWARKEILNSWEVNQAHFCDLWFKFGYVWLGSGTIHSCILALAHTHCKEDDLRKFLTTLGEPLEVTVSVVTALSVLLPVSTFREWNSIFNHLIKIWDNLASKKDNLDLHLDVLELFGSAVSVLAFNLKQNKDMFPCYQYCLRNFGRLVGICCPKMNGGCYLRTFERLFIIIKTIEDDNEKKCCWEICSPALMEVIEWMKKKKVDEEDRKAVKEMLISLESDEVVGVVGKNFI